MKGTATAVRLVDVKSGNGLISTESGVLNGEPGKRLAPGSSSVTGMLDATLGMGTTFETKHF